MHSSNMCTERCNGRFSCHTPPPRPLLALPCTPCHAHTIPCMSPHHTSPPYHACPLPHMPPSPPPCMPPAMHAPMLCIPPAMHAPMHAPHTWPTPHMPHTTHAPLPCHTPPPVNRITDACENITLPQLGCGR